jgi:hypothetical protein
LVSPNAQANALRPESALTSRCSSDMSSTVPRWVSSHLLVPATARAAIASSQNLQTSQKLLQVAWAAWQLCNFDAHLMEVSPAPGVLPAAIRASSSGVFDTQYSPGGAHAPGAWSTPCRCGCFLYEFFCAPCAAGDIAGHLSPHAQDGACPCQSRFCCFTCLLCLTPYVGPALATCRLWDLRQKLMERDRIPYDGVGFFSILCCLPCYLAQQRRHVADREQQLHRRRHHLDHDLESANFSPPPVLALRGAGKDEGAPSRSPRSRSPRSRSPHSRSPKNVLFIDVDGDAPVSPDLAAPLRNCSPPPAP